MLCPKCQTQSPEGSKFCINCGVNLTTPTPTSPQVPPQPPIPTQQVPQTQSLSKSWWEKWWGLLLLMLLTSPIGMLIIYLILKKSSLSQNVKIILTIIIGLFFFSLSLSWGLSQAKQQKTPKTPSLPSSPSVKREPISEPTLTPTPTPAPVIQTVGTEFQGVEASLNKIERGVNIVTAFFTFTLTGTPRFSFTTYIVDPSIKKERFDSYYDLSLAYLIDDASQMKYEVMKDAAGKSLASLLINKSIEKGQSIALYAQFTAPPETTKTVTIILPMVQPFTGVRLE